MCSSPFNKFCFFGRAGRGRRWRRQSGSWEKEELTLEREEPVIVTAHVLQAHAMEARGRSVFYVGPDVVVAGGGGRGRGRRSSRRSGRSQGGWWQAAHRWSVTDGEDGDGGDASQLKPPRCNWSLLCLLRVIRLFFYCVLRKICFSLRKPAIAFMSGWHIGGRMRGLSSSDSRRVGNLFFQKWMMFYLRFCVCDASFIRWTTMFVLSMVRMVGLLVMGDEGVPGPLISGGAQFLL